jgi:uncharacterized membrane protein YfcA
MSATRMASSGRTRFVYPASVPTEILTAISGAISSFLSGLLGIGGGLVLAPLLLYAPPFVGAAALPVKLITGLTIVQAVSGSVLGTLRHRRYGNVSPRLVRTMGPVGGVASLAGALVSRDAPDRLLIFIFAAFSIAGAVALLLPVRTQEGGVADLEVNVPLAAALAALIGFFGGMVGIGAIAFIIAALVYVLRIPTRVAIGSSLAIGFFSAVAAFVGKAATAQIDPLLGAIVFASAVVASPIGAAVSQRSRPRLLMSLLAALVILTGARMLWQAFTGV